MSAERRLLDTNVIVRHLVQDDPLQCKIASDLFAQCDQGTVTLVILPSVLAETVFVLESFYKHPRANIAATLSSLISSPGIEVDELANQLNALDWYQQTRLHFVDCVLAATSLAEELEVSTFDRDLKKVCYSKP